MASSDIGRLGTNTADISEKSAFNIPKTALSAPPIASLLGNSIASGFAQDRLRSQSRLMTPDIEPISDNVKLTRLSKRPLERERATNILGSRGIFTNLQGRLPSRKELFPDAVIQ
jgi:hypothetical protein